MPEIEKKSEQKHKATILVQALPIIVAIDELHVDIQLQAKEMAAIPPYFLSTNCSTKITLSKANTRALKDNSNDWNATVLCNQVAKWTVKLIGNCKELMIGVAPQSVDLNSMVYNSCGWYWCVSDGNKYCQNGTTVNSLHGVGGKCNSNGTIIECTYTGGTFAVSVNGKPSVALFSNLPLDLHPAFNVFSQNCCFELQ